MNALHLNETDQLKKEFKRLLGGQPETWNFETKNTLWARVGSVKYWLTTYPDGVLKFDVLLAKAIAAHKTNAK